MEKLALELPLFGNINNPPGLRFSESAQAGSTKFGFIIGEFLVVFYYFGGFLMLAWLFWGIFQYILAQGKKEELAKARQRITWALLGFLFLTLSFFISQYAQTIFPQAFQFNKIQEITNPSESRCSGPDIMGCEPKSCVLLNGVPTCR